MRSEGGFLGSYPVSVVIPTRVGWPDMRISVDAVLPQIQESGGQLVIADASGRPTPDWASSDGTVWLSMPDAPGYALRQAGYAAAQAPLVAVTEDHCAPAPDWLREIISEHAQDPDADVIFGVVENGTPDHLIDWALYGVGYLAWAPPSPLESGSPGHANLSFKARTFGEVRPTGDSVLEFRYIDELRRAGRRVVASDRLRVTHYQSAGVPKTAWLFFHNGRAIAGIRREHMEAMDWVRTFLPGPIAAYRTLRTIRLANTKPAVRPAIIRSLPFIAMLHGFHAAGESIGYMTGPGNSPRHLH